MRLHSFALAGLSLAVTVQPLFAQCESTFLWPADPGPFQSFGAALACEGQRFVAGAPGDDEAATDGGAVYVFDRAGNGWQQAVKLLPGDPSNGKRFGFSVDLDGDRVLVGAYADDLGGFGAGAAYVFEHAAGGWSELVKLTAPVPSTDQFFGSDVALEDDLLVVGSPRRLSSPTAGSAFVFEHVGGAWSFRAELAPSDGSPGDVFGTAVAIAGSQVLVGAPRHDDGAVDRGAMYVYEEIAGTWQEVEKVLSVSMESARFGADLAADGDRVAIGAPLQAIGLGAVHLHERGALGWEAIAELVGALPLTVMGQPVDFRGDLLVAGAVAGIRAYTYGGTWEETTFVHREFVGGYGGAAAIDGNDVLVGAFTESTQAAFGGAVVFEALRADLGVATCFAVPTSTGAAAALRAFGCEQLAPNDLTLVATSLPADRFGYFLAARTQDDTPLAGGSQGLLCLGLPVLRFAGDILNSGAGGTMRFAPDLGAFPQSQLVLPGDTWNFQLWFRDANPGPTSNTSPAVAVTFATNADPAVQFPDTLFAEEEGDVDVAIAVSLSQRAATDVQVPFTFAGSATELVDYRVETPSPLTVPAGELASSIRVTLFEDGATEPDEEVTLTLGAPTGAVPGTAPAATLTIVDDD